VHAPPRGAEAVAACGRPLIGWAVCSAAATLEQRI
jgi:hypothetical protein